MACLLLGLFTLDARDVLLGPHACKCVMELQCYLHYYYYGHIIHTSVGIVVGIMEEASLITWQPLSVIASVIRGNGRHDWYSKKKKKEAWLGCFDV